MTGLVYERSAKQIARDEQVLARVKRGIELLEEEYGPNWASLIDLENLELTDGSACVLGQVCHGYEKGLRDFNLEDGDASDEHGFSIYQGGWVDEFQEHDPEWDAWEALQASWEREIAARVQRPNG